MKKTAIIIGATGLVGSSLVKQLISDPDYPTIKVLTRRSIDNDHPKIQEYLVDFDHIDIWKKDVTGDVLFSSMGTTIKKAGSKENQYKIDFTYQFETAKAAAENGVENYVLISSMGANSKSKIFYSRMKGELDEAVKELPFKKVFILRPSALVGERPEDRAGEKVMIKVTSFLVKVLPFLRKYKPIDDKIVAKAMINVLNQPSETKAETFENLDLFRLAKA